VLEATVEGGRRLCWDDGHGRRYERREDGADADAAGDLVAKATGEVYSVAVTSTFFEALQVSGVHEFGDEGGRSPFGYSYCSGNVPQTERGIARQTYQNMAVMGEERPCPAAIKFFHDRKLYERWSI
jgi:hypothetical protein